MPASGDQASLGILGLLQHPEIILPHSWAWPVIVFILGKTLYRHVNFEIVHVMQASRCGTCKIVAWNRKLACKKPVIEKKISITLSSVFIYTCLHFYLSEKNKDAFSIYQL